MAQREHDIPELPKGAGDPVRHPLVEMLVIGAPTVVTMTSYTVMQFVDGMMVAHIQPPNPAYVAAQGNGGMFVWLAMAACLGLLSLINSFVSQNLGAGTPEKGAAYAWNGIWLAACASILFIPYALLMGPIFKAIHPAPEQADLVRMELSYAHVLIAGAFLTLASRGLANYFFGMHKPGVVMVAVLLGNVVNVFANAVLIFGAAGAPEGTPFREFFRSIAQSLGVDAMGVTGAALGTVIGTAFELVIPFCVFLGPRWNTKYHTRAAWRPASKPLKDLLRVGWPAGLMMGNELVCWGMLMAWLVPMGGEAAGEDPVVHNAAGWIALRYMHVAFMPAIGLSIAVSAMVGRAMGMGRPDLAAARAWLGLKVTLTYMGVCALAFVIFRGDMISVFVPSDMSPEARDAVLRVGSSIMIAAAVFQLFDACAITMSASLRGAGDTVWPGIATIVLSWSLIVGGGLLMIQVAPGLGSLGPWTGAASYIVVLGIVLLARFMQGKWRSIRLAGPAREGEGPVTTAYSVEGSEEALAGVTPGSA
ncbi:MAG: MATE family efflux transporter [Phycisphaerales bacterium]